MFPEKTEVFLLEALCTVMFFLAGDVMDPNRTKGVGHRETYRIRKRTICKYVLCDCYAFTPALRDGADLEPSISGAEAPAYYQGVPPDFAEASSGRPGRYV